MDSEIYSKVRDTAMAQEEGRLKQDFGSKRKRYIKKKLKKYDKKK